MKQLVILLFSVWITSIAWAQAPVLDSSLVDTPMRQLDKRKLYWVSGACVGTYSASMTGLYSLWYKNYSGGRFHTFNDNTEWLQMDKAGHAFSSFTLSRIGYESLAWTGLSKTKAALCGTGSAMAVMLSIELFDGYSNQWGFSYGDIAANTVGASSFLVQELLWKETRIKYCYSFHSTAYASIRPDLLGTTFTEQMLKDYNGQTIWLSGNIRSFAPALNKLPKWINLAIGYGADGMVGGEDNLFTDNNNELVDYSNTYPRKREFYLSLDADLTKIKMKPGLLKTLFGAIGIIKIPAPTLEMSQQGRFKFHPLYF